jgi:ribosome-associated toxin RatA of RatAB toxin-antitoxin module
MRVEATPEESVAVFWDVNDHKNFISNLTKSVITQRVSASVVQADYTLDVPFPASDEDYTVRNTLTGNASKEVYAITWAMVRADTTKKIEGSVRFEKLGTGAIMAYRNFVVPGSGLAGIGAIRDQAMKQVRQTGQAVAKRVVDLRTKQPAKLQAQVEAVRAALK